ncbi:hypothetical protein ACFPYI_11135 [Halomarina salina]|uniref:Enoyl-CoA hydratase n=1 Tax=Halomarina salina TaxID=1872699 RepID=A0ABD5RMX6_9EURY|nr:hypothetical protein [Halomarina salina]
MADPDDENFETTLDDGAPRAETEGMVRAAQTDDFDEGVRAFVERRSPGFEGH